VRMVSLHRHDLICSALGIDLVGCCAGGSWLSFGFVESKSGACARSSRIDISLWLFGHVCRGNEAAVWWHRRRLPIS
jgi:hypothetical protein